MVDHLWQGDEQMDAVVQAFRRVGMAEGRAMLDAALDDGIGSVLDPPAELVALFDRLDNPPQWYDPAVWERGRQLWINASFAGKTAMLALDILATFVGAEVSSATGATGRLVNDFVRRTFETNTWFLNATRAGGMDRYSPVFKDTVRVRLMHSQARAGLRKSWGDEHFEQHGNPISNGTMMGAATNFGLMPLLADHAYGRRCSTDDLDAVMTYWSYIAYVFGVAEELIPRSGAEAIEMFDYIGAYTGGPTEWTGVMAGAADSALDNTSGVRGLLSRAAVGPMLGALAYFAGEPLVRALTKTTSVAEVNLRPWIALTGLTVKANIVTRRVLDRFPFAEQRMIRRARRSDLFWNLNVRFAKALAARQDIHTTPYDHHDATAHTPAGCPIGMN
ncbi:DUF2236 domain-containing protein [Nocardia sp. NBC_01499]